MDMNSTSSKATLLRLLLVAGTWAFLSVSGQLTAQQPSQKLPLLLLLSVQKPFDSPQQAADALVAAAGQFDERILREIFGPGGEDIVFSGEYPQGPEASRLTSLQKLAKRKASPWIRKRGTGAFLLVGNEDWPFPVPIVKLGAKWRLMPSRGRQELLYRRIGSNELDASDICRGYVKHSTNTHSRSAKATMQTSTRSAL